MRVLRRAGSRVKWICGMMAVLPDERLAASTFQGTDTVTNPGGVGAANAGQRVGPSGRSQSADRHPSPGVNDGNSGTTLTMELARVAKAASNCATLMFMCHAGKNRADRRVSSRAEISAEKAPVVGVLSNDIVNIAAAAASATGDDQGTRRA